MAFIENINIYIGLYLDAYDKSSEDLGPESSTVTLTNTGTAVFMQEISNLKSYEFFSFWHNNWY
jgi:hypothetical protein